MTTHTGAHPCQCRDRQSPGPEIAVRHKTNPRPARQTLDMDTHALAQLAIDAAGDAGPGVVIGIYRGGELTHHASAGMASVELSAPVHERTRFDIASMSKQFTATAILLLARDGLLALTDDIRAHLPELRLSTPVTIAQCLQHTGGLREWLQLTGIAGRSLTRITQNQTLAFVSGLTELNFPPGTAFSYSNTGYVLAASLVQRLTGRTLGEFTTERLFAPLGMHRTLFREDSLAVLDDFAYGYATVGDRLLRADTEECAVGDGGLATSVSELGPWFRFLRDGDVIGADIRDALVDSTPVFPDGSRGTYALGIYHATLGGSPMVGHAGGVLGYRSQLFYLPEHDLGVVALTNHSAVDARLVALDAARLATGIAEDVPPSPVAGTVDASAHAGWWLMPGADEAVHTEARDDGTLELSGLQSGRFTLAEDDWWYADDAEGGLRLRVEGDDLRVGIAAWPGRDMIFQRCSAPDENLPIPSGVYESPELGTLATIHDDGAFQLGLELTGRLEPGAGGTLRAGPASLRTEGDDLLLSLFGAERLRFVRQPADTTIVGVPRGLDAS